MMQGAIFDVDGTLLDSMYIWDTIGEDYLRSIGHEPKENLRETFKAMSLQQAASYYQTEYGVTLSTESIVEGVNNMVEWYYKNEVYRKTGVKRFLQNLKEQGVKMCIATATDTHLVKAALKRCKISEYFSHIFTCTSVGHGKDEPVIYREAMKYLGTDKNNTVVFEDALYAVRTAKSDGFIVAAVYDIHEKGQSEIKALADVYISDFSQFDPFECLRIV